MKNKRAIIGIGIALFGLVFAVVGSGFATHTYSGTTQIVTSVGAAVVGFIIINLGFMYRNSGLDNSYVGQEGHKGYK